MAYEGLLSGLADEDKYLGLLGIGLGLLSGNQGRSRQQAFANAMGGAAQGGLGLLGPIMQNKQAQAQRALAERQFGLEERKVSGQEELNSTHAKLYRQQASQMERQNALMNEIGGLLRGGQTQPTQQSPQAMIDAGDGAYMQTAPIVRPQQADSTQRLLSVLTPEMLARLELGGIKTEGLRGAREAALPKEYSGGFVGTAEDLGRFRGGFAPRLIAGQGGEVTQIQPDGRGSVTVTAPGLEAFRQMQDVRNRSAADLEIVDVKMPDGSVQKMTRSQAADLARGTGQPPVAPIVPRTQGGIPVVPPAALGTPERQAFEQVSGMPAGVPQRATAPVDQNYQRLIESFVRGGVPPTSTAPGYAGTLPGFPSGQTEAQRIEAERRKTGALEVTKSDEKRVTELETKIPGLMRTLSRLQAIEALNADDKTYAASGADIKRQLGSIAQGFGLEIKADKTANTELYIAHVAELLKERLATKDYGAGSGVSNLDVVTAGKPLPEVAKTREGRARIIQALRIDTEKALNDAKAAREYFDSNQYSLRGFRFPSETQQREPLPQGKATPRDRQSILRQYGVQ